MSLLPCFHYTPPSRAVEPRTAAPPKLPSEFGDFVEFMIDRFGEHFTWVELWNEPNNPSEWDTRLDADWQIFGAMIREGWLFVAMLIVLLLALTLFPQAVLWLPQSMGYR